MKTIDMTKGEPFKLIILYSLPMLVGQLFQQLYSMCDTIIVGRLLGYDALAAVGNTGPMNFLVLGFLYGLTSGFAVVTAQKFGAHDEKELKHSVAMNIMLNFAVGVFLTILACLLARPILVLTNTPDRIIEQSYSYIFIIFSGILLNVLYSGSACVLRAVGDSKTPLYFLVFSSILNIVLDYFFIAKLNLHVAGAALATIISQGVSGVLCIVWIIIKFPILHVKRVDFKWDFKFAMAHLSLGMNMGFQFCITAIGVVILQGALNVFGAAKIAAYTAAQKVEHLVTIAANVFGVTMANYSGQNLGAGNIKRIKNGVTKAVILTISFAVAAAVLAWMFGDAMTLFFLDKEKIVASELDEILQASRIYLRMCSIFFPVLFVLFIYRNTLQGIGKGFWPLMGGVFELIARVVGAYTLPSVMGYSGICASGPAAWIAATAPLAVAYYIIMSSKRQKIQ
ncbi:MAG: MATE family efflux transporter [Treponema sp.]|nr:MATE family efflux transporter [Treponema sp.]